MFCGKKYARRMCSEGFTLVELLIVIVVIGVLSAMMMLSSTEAVSSAKATDIINNLVNWKKATISWYVDHLDEVTTTWNGVQQRFADHIHAPDIVPYLNTSFKSVENKGAWDSSNGRYFTDHIPGGGTNTLTGEKTNGIWLIGYEMPTDDARVKEKLEARAKSVGLLWKDGGNLYQYTADGSNHHRVWIMVMDFD